MKLIFMMFNRVGATTSADFFRIFCAYLNKYNILHKSQSGFRKKHSYNTALISLLDKWLNNIDKGEITGAICFDLRKAFDVVDHEILLQKLRLHKFDSRAMAWMQSYISNRYLCIIKNRSSSSMQAVTSGVPQGSVLAKTGQALRCKR